MGLKSFRVGEKLFLATRTPPYPQDPTGHVVLLQAPLGVVVCLNIGHGMVRPRRVSVNSLGVRVQVGWGYTCVLQIRF